MQPPAKDHKKKDRKLKSKKELKRSSSGRWGKEENQDFVKDTWTKTTKIKSDRKDREKRRRSDRKSHKRREARSQSLPDTNYKK